MLDQPRHYEERRKFIAEGRLDRRLGCMFSEELVLSLGEGSACVSSDPGVPPVFTSIAWPHGLGCLTPRRWRILGCVPFYMDRHDFAGLTAVDAANMHLKDLAMQGRFGVQFLTYWFDHDRQTAFCLAKAPSGDAIEAVHRESHGSVPGHVIEVDQREVQRFMGVIVDHPPGEAYVETAFRTIVFTDMEGSTSLTQRLGDARAMTVLREHDRIAGEAISSHGGSEVKHTGDGLMAAFPSVVGAIESAVQIQRRLAEADDRSGLRVRIGMSAGEPVTERNDLFGAVVQLAARLCSRAEPGSVLVSSAVRDLALGKGFIFRKHGRLNLKGFDEPVHSFEVVWQPPPSVETAVAGESEGNVPG